MGLLDWDLLARWAQLLHPTEVHSLCDYKNAKHESSSLELRPLQFNSDGSFLKSNRRKLGGGGGEKQCNEE